MKNYIVRATAANNQIRAFCAQMTDIAERARRIHDLTPVTSAALGRALVAAGIMSKLLKGENDTITIQFKGDGPMRGMVVVTDSKAGVRGYVYHPSVDLPLNSVGKLDVSGALGKNGYVNVIKDYGLKEPYIGFVNLVSGEIAEDIAYYFASSEQTPSVVALGVLVHPDGHILHAGGYILQLMPGATEETIKFLEEKMALIPSVTTLLSEGMGPEDVLQLILGEKELKILEQTPSMYRCTCSFERMGANIISLGTKEIRELISEQETTELVCHFCNQKYYFTKHELQNILYTMQNNHHQE